MQPPCRTSDCWPAIGGPNQFWPAQWLISLSHANASWEKFRRRILKMHRTLKRMRYCTLWSGLDWIHVACSWLAILSKIRTWPGRGCVVNMSATTLRPQYNLFNAIWRSWGAHDKSNWHFCDFLKTIKCAVFPHLGHISTRRATKQKRPGQDRPG